MEAIKKIITIILGLFLLIAGRAAADMEVHFLDVGQGDCAILIADGDAMIIDGGPGSHSRKVYTYIQDMLELESIRYMVATHPHEDHVGGLVAAMNAAPVEAILTPVLESDLTQFQDLMTYAEMSGTQVIIPQEGDQFALGNAVFTVLARWPEAWTVNDLSLVIRVDYGETSFLFTGDAESYLEYVLIDSGNDLQSDVLKVAHHGSETSSTAEFLEAVRPEYAVISCGKLNTYQHPRQDTLLKLDGIGATIFRTDLQGDIIFHTDGRTITIETEKETRYENILLAPESALYDDLPEGSLIGNSRTYKFHRPECEFGQAISPRNLVVFGSLQDALKAGYSPCGSCRPADGNAEKGPKNAREDEAEGEDADNLMQAETEAQRMERQYGITILIGDACKGIDTVGFEIGDQPAGRSPLLDLMAQADYKAELDIIDNCLAMYPEGCFEKMRSEEAPKGLRILLADQILEHGQSMAGVTTIQDGYYNIFLGVGAFLARNVHHEIWHAMEYRITWDQPEAFSGWDGLNPEGYQYEEAYFQQDIFAQAEEQGEWFVRGYSEISEMEDRATVAEAYFMQDVAWWEEHPLILAKLNYMRDAARHFFGNVFPEK